MKDCTYTNKESDYVSLDMMNSEIINFHQERGKFIHRLILRYKLLVVLRRIHYKAKKAYYLKIMRGVMKGVR